MCYDTDIAKLWSSERCPSLASGGAEDKSADATQYTVPTMQGQSRVVSPVRELYDSGTESHMSIHDTQLWASAYSFNPMRSSANPTWPRAHGAVAGTQ